MNGSPKRRFNLFFWMDPQKGDPSGSPKRRSRWIPKKGDPLYPSWIDPEKGDPGGSPKWQSTLCLPLLTEWIPKKLVQSILTFIEWIPKMGNRFKMDPQKSYTLHLVDRLSFAVSFIFLTHSTSSSLVHRGSYHQIFLSCMFK